MSDGMNNRDDIYSKSVRAGKRTYFFDVKTTRGNDLYLTITESKRRYGEEGKFHYEKHKLFLYKEDFDKFSEGLLEAVNKIEELRQSGDYSEESPMDRAVSSESSSTPPAPEYVGETEKKEEFTDVSFDDLLDE